MKNEILFSWLNSAILDKYWERPIDLHIDEIDKNWKDPKSWQEATKEVLIHANRYLWDQSNGRSELFWCLAFIYLKSGEVRLGTNFTPERIIQEYDLSPPAIFVVPRKWDVLMQTMDQRVRVPQHDICYKSDMQFKAYFKEVLHDNELEYVRNLIYIPVFKSK